MPIMGHRIITNKTPPKKLMMPTRISDRDEQREKDDKERNCQLQYAIPSINQQTKSIMNSPRIRSRREKKRTVRDGPIVKVKPNRNRISPNANMAESNMNNIPRNSSVIPYTTVRRKHTVYNKAKNDWCVRKRNAAETATAIYCMTCN